MYVYWYLLDYKWSGEKRQTVANQQQPPVATGKTINMFTLENQMSVVVKLLLPILRYDTMTMMRVA